MKTKKLLKIATWLFLCAGIVGLTISAVVFLGGGPPSDYGVAAIGGTFWVICAAVTLFLRSRLA